MKKNEPYSNKEKMKKFEEKTIQSKAIFEGRVISLKVVKRVRNSNEISVAGLAEGVYLLRVRDEQGVLFTERVSVVK